MNVRTLRTSVCSILLVFFLFNYPSSVLGNVFSEARLIMRARDALLRSNPKAALPNFETIAQLNPDYINCAQGLCIGIWTYLGRTYHELGNNQKALETLKKGTGRHNRDRFNRIYLGLVMVKTGQTAEGRAELDAGLVALGAWLSSSDGRGSTAQYWDPDRELQKAIVDSRKLLEGKEVNWNKVTIDIHWLGVHFEQEARDVHRDKQFDREGEND